MPPLFSSDDELAVLDEEYLTCGSDYAESPSSPATEIYTESQEDIFEVDERPTTTKWLDSIRVSQFVYPRSQYDNYVPPLPLSTERRVVREFMQELSRQKELDPEARPRSIPASIGINDSDSVEFDLSDFSIYLPETKAIYGGTMIGLQNLATKSGHTEHFFDGVLSLGLHRRYVQKVPFQLCSIGNYGQEFDGVGEDIWIQSNIGMSQDFFYRLKYPSAEYRRYHKGFLWLANLSKHFVDYADHCYKCKRDMSIHNFRIGFHRWLQKVHKNSKALQNWLKQFNGKDFRGHVAANIEFLYKEICGTYPELRKLQLWKEIRDLSFIPMQQLREKKTVVTSYVYDCFSHLKFGPALAKVLSSNDVQLRQNEVNRNFHPTTNTPFKQHGTDTQKRTMVVIGDVLAVSKDDADIAEWKNEHSKWKPSDEQWYVLVQKIHISKQGRRFFDIIWLYSPSDTTCAKMKYPYSRELFLSDNCSCSRRRISEDDVLYKVSVSWNGSPGSSDANFFIRQTYLMDDNFVTLQECHKQCVHIRGEVRTPLQEFTNTYRVGDTILFVPPSLLKSKHDLEPGEIADLSPNREEHVAVRRLYRFQDLDDCVESMRANELVYSDEIFNIPIRSVERKCLIRFFTEEAAADRKIPPPYNRGGTGNAFYIVKRLFGKSLQPVCPDIPKTLIQGPDFEARPNSKRLRGLDLYCGGGNFGRGLEEGGGIHMTHAVDLNPNAVHTYHANLKDPELTKLYFGSVNDLLAEAIRGNPSKSSVVPLPGEIDFISGGSPCPGFSFLNSLRDGAKGLRDQSLVASVAAFIDFYRPKYALLENVVTMAKKGAKREEDVLSQLICCIVGMGYQVQVFNLDAWSVGSPQSRGRLFVSVAAPGLEPPPPPALSHSHPKTANKRGLGKMANGLSFGERRFEKTPFEYVTAGEATQEVPGIGDGMTFHNTWHSDHRMSRGIPHMMKARIEAIPLYPKGMNYVTSAHRMLPSEQALFPKLTRHGRPTESTKKSSKAFGRVHPQTLFPTISTTISPACSRTGRVLHWDQQRLLTVLEARRAQSFPDEEVLVGSPALQWKIVGNSVARTAALALGISFCEAWVKSCEAQDRNKKIHLVEESSAPITPLALLSLSETSPAALKSSVKKLNRASIENSNLKYTTNKDNSDTLSSRSSRKRYRQNSTSESYHTPSYKRLALPTLESIDVASNHDGQPDLGNLYRSWGSDSRSGLTVSQRCMVKVEDTGPLESDLRKAEDFGMKPLSPPSFWHLPQSLSHSTKSTRYIRSITHVSPPQQKELQTLESTQAATKAGSSQRRYTILAQANRLNSSYSATASISSAEMQAGPESTAISQTPEVSLPKASGEVIGLTSLFKEDDDLIVVSSAKKSDRYDQTSGRGGGPKAESSGKASTIHGADQIDGPKYTPVDNSLFTAYETTNKFMRW